MFGDIVVDDFQNPKEIIGVADGSGDFKKIYNLGDKKRVSKLKKIINDK